jgi:hypothetical protein
MHHPWSLAMSVRPSFAVAALSVLAAALSFSAQAATVIPVSADGQWHAFTVDAQSTVDGRTSWIDTDYNATAGNASDLSFSFTVADHAILRVVDLFAAGDTYSVHIASSSGSFDLNTSLVAPHDLGDAVLPFADTTDAAWASSADFSQLQWTLAAGSYTVSGSLLQSVTDNGVALNSTGGALSVTAVPEPSGLALALAALGFVLFVFRRRAAK